MDSRLDFYFFNPTANPVQFDLRMPNRKKSRKSRIEPGIDSRVPPSWQEVLDRERRKFEQALFRPVSGKHQSGVESLFAMINRLRGSIRHAGDDLGLRPDELIELRTRLHAILDDMLMRAVMGLIDRRISQAADEAQRDPVTRFANRAAFDQRLAAEFDRSRIHNLNLSIILFDIDHFKRINDRFGHPTGDQVLRETANVLKSSLRHSDMIFRYGGDEFAAICPATSEHALKIILPRIDRRIEAHFDKTAFAGLIGTSAGAATCPIDGTEADNLIRAADRRLYECKRERHCSEAAHS